MAVYKLLCSSQWESEVWKQNFHKHKTGSVSAVKEVKHELHNHLSLDSAKKVNTDVLACFCLWLFGMFFGGVLLYG